MRLIVAGQEAHSASEFAELALGVDAEPPTADGDRESTAERVVRLAVARDGLRGLAPAPARTARTLRRPERFQALDWKAAA
ncbi:hypothetical protein AB0C76_39200 [Kitasatospora sp. NPDC048722]|uniref:hypothetical protein n=1 Tax=Kitasatospora sp. NPDC048722 TaxID=3155639 RepID=UPI00340DCB7E